MTTGAVIGGALVLALVPLAIPTSVIGPKQPSEPVAVFLVDYGRTPALVLPADENRMVAYVYGDWNYYVLRNQGAVDSIAALLWPTQGAVGRREIAGPLTAEAVRRGIGSEVEEIHTLRVDRRGVERLRSELDAIHHDRLETAVSAYGMTFVHHSQPYTYWSNSNHMTAAWLKALGCEIRGPAFGSWWRVEARD